MDRQYNLSCTQTHHGKNTETQEFHNFPKFGKYWDKYFGFLKEFFGWFSCLKVLKGLIFWWKFCGTKE